MLTITPMMVIVRRMSVLTLTFPLNAAATLPIIREMEGRMVPARTEQIVPTTRRTLSVVPMYEKNFVNAIWGFSGSISSSILPTL